MCIGWFFCPYPTVVNKNYIDQECAICLEMMIESEWDKNHLVQMKPCGHLFHTSCWVKWLKKSGQKYCALCLQRIKKACLSDKNLSF